MGNTRHNKRIVIAYVIDFLASPEGLTGGTERQLCDLLDYIDQSSFKPVLFCLRKYVDTPYWDAIKCEKHLLHVYSLASPKGIMAFLSFVHFLKRQSVDIVQTFFHDSTLFGVLAARFSGVRRTISCRRDTGFWYDQALLRNLSITNKLTNHVLANCKAVKLAVMEHECLPPDKVDVIHNGLDLATFDEAPPGYLFNEFNNVGKYDKVVGMVANYNREVKRADLFIKAAAEVIREHKNVKFLIIGGGKMECELKNLICKLNLEGSLIIGGKQDYAVPYIKSFDVGVLTSDSEGFSNVLLEYMAAGIPVVATDVGGNREIIQNSDLGVLVPKGDYKAIASAISGLLSDQNRCERLGSNARRHIEDNFSWSTKIKEMERYYEKLMEL